MGGVGSGRVPADISGLSPVRRVYLLAGRGYSIAEIAQETGVSERDVRRCLSILRHGYDTVEEREQRRAFVERALITGLATGDTVVQIARILGDTLPMTDKALRALRDRYGAKTNAHLVALVLATGQQHLLPEPQARAFAEPGRTPTERRPVTVYSGSTCPDCGMPLRYTEGCEKCEQCGYTKC